MELSPQGNLIFLACKLILVQQELKAANGFFQTGYHKINIFLNSGTKLLFCLVLLRAEMTFFSPFLVSYYAKYFLCCMNSKAQCLILFLFAGFEEICKNKPPNIRHLKNKPLDCAVGMWMREGRGLVLSICKIVLLLKPTKYTYFLLKQQTMFQFINVLITHLRCLAVKLQPLRYILLEV